MHSFTVICDTFSNEEKVAVVVPITSVHNSGKIQFIFFRPYGQW